MERNNSIELSNCIERSNSIEIIRRYAEEYNNPRYCQTHPIAFPMPLVPLLEHKNADFVLGRGARM